MSRRQMVEGTADVLPCVADHVAVPRAALFYLSLSSNVLQQSLCIAAVLSACVDVAAELAVCANVP